MRKLLVTLFALFALALLSAAQTGGADKDAQKSDKASGGGSTITGCLSGPNSEGVYTLKTAKHEVEVGGLDDLSKHVGHEVKLHGTWAKSGKAIGEKEETAGATGKEAKESKEEKGERHFKVSSVEMVSEKCSGGGEPSTPK